jgi:hypothetical protein
MRALSMVKWGALIHTYYCTEQNHTCGELEYLRGTALAATNGGGKGGGGQGDG